MDEYLLHYIFYIWVIPQDPQHYIVYPTSIPMKKLSEGPLITGLALRYQKILIHLKVRPF